MGVHGGIGWVYMGALDGCTWGHWMGVHGGIGWVYIGAHWTGVRGRHCMGVHGSVLDNGRTSNIF